MYAHLFFGTFFLGLGGWTKLSFRPSHITRIIGSEELRPHMLVPCGGGTTQWLRNPLNTWWSCLCDQSVGSYPTPNVSLTTSPPRLHWTASCVGPHQCPVTPTTLPPHREYLHTLHWPLKCYVGLSDTTHMASVSVLVTVSSHLKLVDARHFLENIVLKLLDRPFLKLGVCLVHNRKLQTRTEAFESAHLTILSPCKQDNPRNAIGNHLGTLGTQSDGNTSLVSTDLDSHRVGLLTMEPI